MSDSSEFVLTPKEYAYAYNRGCEAVYRAEAKKHDKETTLGARASVKVAAMVAGAKAADAEIKERKSGENVAALAKD